MLRVLVERPSVATGDVNSGKKQFREVSRRYPDVVRKMKIAFCGSDEEREKGLASAEVFVAWRFPKENLAARAPHLKWIQLTGAGVEHLMPLGLAAGGRHPDQLQRRPWSQGGGIGDAGPVVPACEHSRHDERPARPSMGSASLALSSTARPWSSWAPAAWGRRPSRARGASASRSSPSTVRANRTSSPSARSRSAS